MRSCIVVQSWLLVASFIFSFAADAAENQWTHAELTQSVFDSSVPWGSVNPNPNSVAYFYMIEDVVPVLGNSRILVLVHKYAQIDPSPLPSYKNFAVIESIVCDIYLDRSKTPRFIRPDRSTVGYVSRIQTHGFIPDDHVLLHTSREATTFDIDSTWIWNIRNGGIDDYGSRPTPQGWTWADAAKIIRNSGLHFQLEDLGKDAQREFYSLSDKPSEERSLLLLAHERSSLCLFKVEKKQLGFICVHNEPVSVTDSIAMEEFKNPNNFCFPRLVNGRQKVLPVAIKTRNDIRLVDCQAEGIATLTEFPINDDWIGARFENPIVVSNDSTEIAFRVMRIKDSDATREVLLVASQLSSWKIREFSTIGRPFSIEQSKVLSYGTSEIFSNSIRSGVSSFHVEWSFRDLLEGR